MASAVLGAIDMDSAVFEIKGSLYLLERKDFFLLGALLFSQAINT